MFVFTMNELHLQQNFSNLKYETHIKLMKIVCFTN